MSQFIVRTHRFSYGDNHWRYGAWLRYDGHLAWVYLNKHDRMIVFKVFGVAPSNFFAILIEALDDILGQYPGLKLEKFMPCPCNDAEDSEKSCQYRFHYEDLINRIRNKRDEAECQKSFRNVSIHQLLYGLEPLTLNFVINDAEQALHQDIKRIKIYTKHIVELAQRNIAQTIRPKDVPKDTNCPYLFSLLQKEIKEVVNILELQLYCQHEQRPHPIKPAYEIKITREDTQKSYSLMRKILNNISFSLPMIGINLAGFLPDYSTKIAQICESLLIDLRIGDRVKIENDEVYFVKGYLLREFYQLLDELDPGHRWGKLKPWKTESSHIIWLCPEHYPQE